MTPKAMMAGIKHPYWVSWWASKVPFTLDSPWWVSGTRFFDNNTEQNSICAAVMAHNELDAKNMIAQAHDQVNVEFELEFRFCELKLDNWLPFCDRFPKAAWMIWP